MIIYLLCSPGFGVVDIWLPVLWKLKKRKKIQIIFVFPEKSSLNIVNNKSQLFEEAESTVDGVLFMTYSGKWYAADSLSDAKKITMISQFDKTLFMVFDELMFGKPSKIYGIKYLASFFKKILQKKVDIGSHKLGEHVNKLNHFGPASLLLYDITKEHKKVNFEFLQTFISCPRLSMHHGLGAAGWISNNGLKYRCINDETISRVNVIAYPTSSLERKIYENCYGLPPENVRPNGIVRHDREWIKHIINSKHSSLASVFNLDEFVLLIGRPLSPYNPKNRVLEALSNIKKVICDEFNRKIIIKLHPKESMLEKSVYTQAFGLDDYGKKWIYSDRHPLYLAEKCKYGISFYSGVPLDLLAYRKATIEYLDLRGLKAYDNENSLRDECGDPVFSERFAGLVLGASSYEQFRAHVFDLENNNEDVVDQLVEKYKAYFESTEGAIDNVLSDIFSIIQ